MRPTGNVGRLRTIKRRWGDDRETRTGRHLGFTVDANVLIKEITNRGDWMHSLVVRSSVARLFLADFVWEEVEDEVPKRFTRMVNATKGMPLPEESVPHLHMRGQMLVVFKFVGIYNSQGESVTAHERDGTLPAIIDWRGQA